MRKDDRPILKYKIEKNDKGETVFTPRYLTETPKEEVDRLNTMFNDWKNTRQIQYDNDGNRK